MYNVNTYTDFDESLLKEIYNPEILCECIRNWKILIENKDTKETFKLNEKKEKYIYHVNESSEVYIVCTNCKRVYKLNYIYNCTYKEDITIENVDTNAKSSYIVDTKIEEITGDIMALANEIFYSSYDYDKDDLVSIDNIYIKLKPIKDEYLHKEYNSIFYNGWLAYELFKNK